MLTTLFWTVLLFFLRVYIFVNVKIILLSLRWIFSKNEAYRELGVNENGWIDFICVKIKSSFSHFRHGEIVLSTFHQFVLRLKLAWFREASCEAEWQTGPVTDEATGELCCRIHCSSVSPERFCRWLKS